MFIYVLAPSSSKTELGKHFMSVDVPLLFHYDTDQKPNLALSSITT
jgi:hypothetical protein